MKALRKIHADASGTETRCEILPLRSDSNCPYDDNALLPFSFVIPSDISIRAPLNPSFKRVLEFVHLNYMHRLTLDMVAQHVFLNKTYISQMFTKYLGVSFVAYLECIRIGKGLELLADTEFSVAEIANKIGYSNSSYFTKVFKKRTGMAPLEYRYSLGFDRIQHTYLQSGHSPN